MKKRISTLLLALLILIVFTVPAMATEPATASGFYNIGTADKVTINPLVTNKAAQVVNQDVDNDKKDDVWYINSNRLEVSYTAATSDGYYGIILIEGSGVPTLDNTIFYIDQITAESGTVNFDVYPILPKKTTDLTLYITSNIKDFKLISIPLNYVVDAESPATYYTLGDINNDDIWNSTDALLTLQIGAGIYSEATAQEIAAANVNGDEYVNSTDALMILQYGAGIIDSWD